jgi:hypothetical protein
LNYQQSCSNIRVIGRQIAIALDNIEKIEIENVHIIGHSLGAHMAGYIGKELQLMNKVVDKVSIFLSFRKKIVDKPNLGRITGLDPAGPAFSFPTKWYDEFPKEIEKTHLWHSDAKFVDVIHRYL